MATRDQLSVPEDGVAPVIPRHVAIIMDGNNRFARKQHLPRGEGHRAGKNQLDPIVAEARRLGVEALTVFAFGASKFHGVFRAKCSAKIGRAHV